jgi:hypothetical protein
MGYLNGCERLFWTGLIEVMEFKKRSIMSETLGSDTGNDRRMGRPKSRALRKQMWSTSL